MPKLKIPAHALPFVTRALRGGRGRRYALMSAVLAALTVLLGAYIALGSGSFEREIRTGLGYEENLWERERSEFKVITHDEWSHENSVTAASKARALRTKNRAEFMWAAEHGWNDEIHAFGYSDVAYQIQDGFNTLRGAAMSIPPSVEYRPLRDRAAAYLDIIPPSSEQEVPLDAPGFSWWSPQEIERLESILDADLVPAVEAYSSPLTTLGAIRFIGGCAGILLSLLALAVGPLAAAVRQAAEVHDNTLQPLTGTAMTPSDLSRGLRMGALAPIAIFAAPLVGIFLLTAAIVGAPLRAFLMVAVTLVGAYSMSTIAQLVGHIAGRRRTKDVTGVSLLPILGFMWFGGLAFGFSGAGESEVASLVGMAPQSASAYMQAWAIGDDYVADFVSPSGIALVSLAMGTLAWAVFGRLADLILAHRVGGLEGAPLDRAMAFFGAFSAAVMICVGGLSALEGHVRTEEAQFFYFFGLAVLTVPFAILLMARVPVSEAPERMHRIPLRSLLFEMTGFVGIHMFVATLFAGSHALDVWTSPVALAYMAWCIGVVGLTAIRTATLPARGVVNAILLVFIGFCVLAAGGHVVGWTVVHGLNDADEILAFSQLSPLLGVIQLGVLIALPTLLYRQLSKRLGGLTLAPETLKRAG